MNGYSQEEERAELLEVLEAEKKAMKENEKEHMEAGSLCNPIEVINTK